MDVPPAAAPPSTWPQRIYEFSRNQRAFGSGVFTKVLDRPLFFFYTEERCISNAVAVRAVLNIWCGSTGSMNEIRGGCDIVVSACLRIKENIQGVRPMAIVLSS